MIIIYSYRYFFLSSDKHPYRNPPVCFVFILFIFYQCVAAVMLGTQSKIDFCVAYGEVLLLQLSYEQVAVSYLLVAC